MHSLNRKNKYNGKKVSLDLSKIGGLKITPKNDIKYDDAVEVNSMLLVNPSFIEKLLKKKIKRKLDFYLQYIINLIEDEDADPSNLKLALNDLTRYKSIVEYKYRKYLDEKYIKLLLKKISILEHEIKTKIVYQQYDFDEEKQRTGKSR